MVDVPVVILGDNPPVTEIQPTQVDDILDKIMGRISPVHEGSGTLKVLIYGDPGTGKTTFAATAPKPLIIDVERGTRVLADRGNEVDVLEYVSMVQVEKAIEYLKAGSHAFDKYDTIVLDSISELQKRLIDDQLKVLGGKGNAPVYKADWGVYGENTQRLRMLLSAFRDIPKNLVCTAHAKVEKDDQTGFLVSRPDLTPKLAATVAGIFDIVAYIKRTGKGEYVLRVRPSNTVLAKSRVTALPDEIMSPTWTHLNK